MDLDATIAQLRGDLKRVDQTIKRLEQLLEQRARLRSPRGRRFMSEEERQQLSARIKAYWAQVARAA